MIHFGGMVQIRITGAEIMRTLGRISQLNITMLSVNQDTDVSAVLTVSARDLKKIRALCEKWGDEVEILRNLGLQWIFMGLLRRPLLIFGCLMLVILSFWIPEHILFVRVDGNDRVPANRILEEAERCGIGFGADRREVRSEQIKNELLGAIPQLQWAGVNTYGCVAVISVRERAEPEPQPDSPIGSIVAVRDGVIISCTATNGEPVCTVGQAVRKGETLISGYSDLGLCIRATCAAGEVFAGTDRTICVCLPKNVTIRTDVTNTNTNFSLLIGKKRINLWKDSGICDASCDRMYKEYYVALPGGFRLPLGIAVESYTCYQLESGVLEEAVCGKLLRDCAAGYLQRQMTAGTIMNRVEILSDQGDAFLLDGHYTCTEMIGVFRREEIGEKNG